MNDEMTQAELNELRRQVNMEEWKRLVEGEFLESFLGKERVKTMTETEQDDFVADMALISMGILTYD